MTGSRISTARTRNLSYRFAGAVVGGGGGRGVSLAGTRGGLACSPEDNVRRWGGGGDCGCGTSE
jgi:hypothetical protein